MRGWTYEAVLGRRSDMPPKPDSAEGNALLPFGLPSSTLSIRLICHFVLSSSFIGFFFGNFSSFFRRHCSQFRRWGKKKVTLWSTRVYFVLVTLVFLFFSFTLEKGYSSSMGWFDLVEWFPFSFHFIFASWLSFRSNQLLFNSNPFYLWIAIVKFRWVIYSILAGVSIWWFIICRSVFLQANRCDYVWFITWCFSIPIWNFIQFWEIFSLLTFSNGLLMVTHQAVIWRAWDTTTLHHFSLSLFYLTKFILVGHLSIAFRF